MTDLLSAALAYAARGWHVFPLRPGDKRPVVPDHAEDRCTGRDPRCRAAGQHVGWEARATTDPDRIQRAWTAAPYNIGIACGPSGLLVVDLDTRKPGKTPPTGYENYGHGVRVFTDLCHALDVPVPKDTYTVRTGNGGVHLCYQHPETGPRLRNTTGQYGNGLGWLIDTRGHGGYVVAAGSTVAGRPYTVTRDTDPMALPEWLAGRLAPTPLPPQRPVTVHIGTGRQAAYLDAAIRPALTAIAAAGLRDDGTLNTTLYGASVALGQLVAGGALCATTTGDLLLNAAVAAGHPAPGARRTIASGFRAGAHRPRSVAA